MEINSIQLHKYHGLVHVMDVVAVASGDTEFFGTMYRRLCADDFPLYRVDMTEKNFRFLEAVPVGCRVPSVNTVLRNKSTLRKWRVMRCEQLGRSATFCISMLDCKEETKQILLLPDLWMYEEVAE